MHELLLFGQIPAARYAQLLNVMAGLAAMQPERVVERHIVWRPTRGPVQMDVLRGGGVRQDAQVLKTKKVGQLNQQVGDLYYVRLIQSLAEEDFGEDSGGDVDMDEGDGGVKESEKSNWRLRFEDVPEPGKMTALLRMVEDIDFIEGDPQAYMEALGYRYARSSSFLLAFAHLLPDKFPNMWLRANASCITILCSSSIVC
jgi:mediator of RNA polymerase II transcription subunit 18